MDYQQILELVKEVSKAGLTNFEQRELQHSHRQQKQSGKRVETS